MQNHCYLFNEQCDAEIWLHHLVQGGNWQQDPHLDKQIIFYDTFDWRLYRKQSTLELEDTSGCRQLMLRARNGELLATLDQPEMPNFAWDLPSGQLRQQLEPLSKMRRLLPQAWVHCRQQNLALLNSYGKTVLRLKVVTDRQVIAPQESQHSLQAYLQIVPVRGYRSAVKHFARQLHNDSFVQPVALDPLADTLAVLGRRPAEYSSKLDLQLQPSLTAQQALRTILQQLLGTLRTNVSGTCSNLDSEFLHDLRVAVRRTRSALSQLKGLLPADELTPFRQEFAWLGTITGPTRDLDVYLLKYGDYVQLLPEKHHPDLAPFQCFLANRQAEEQQALANQLTSPRFVRLIADWQTLLQRNRASDPALPDASLPVKQVADRRIWKLFRRCVKQGRAITPACSAEALHELRKTCKKLRYMLEFFQSLYSPTALDILIKSLKGLQDNLGDFQDFEVQSEAMHTFGLQMAETDLAPPATLLAMGMLAESLRQQQQQTRQEFYRRFAAFCDNRNCKLFSQLFRQANGKRQKQPQS